MRGAQTSLSGEVANLSRAVESEAAELRQMGQLLQASFSLGLALQEQQARTASALATLARPLAAAAERAAPVAAPPVAAGPSSSSSSSADLTQVELLRVVRFEQRKLSAELARLQRKQERRKRRSVVAVARRHRKPSSPTARGTPPPPDDDAPPPPSADATARPPPRPAAAEGVCVVCCDRPAEAVLYRCGHRCACLQCAYYLQHQRLSCPLCRATIDDVVRVYGT